MHWLPGMRVRRLTEKGMKNFLGGENILYLEKPVATGVYAFVKPHLMVHLQSEDIILWKLYLY